MSDLRKADWVSTKLDPKGAVGCVKRVAVDDCNEIGVPLD